MFAAFTIAGHQLQLLYWHFAAPPDENVRCCNVVLLAAWTDTDQHGREHQRRTGCGDSVEPGNITDVDACERGLPIETGAVLADVVIAEDLDGCSTATARCRRPRR